jgi:hypothetical protein
MTGCKAGHGVFQLGEIAADLGVTYSLRVWRMIPRMSVSAARVRT